MRDAADAPRGIAAGQLEAFIVRAFEAVSVAHDDARVIAELMTRADLNGADGHGVFRLPQYIRRIKEARSTSNLISASSAKRPAWRSSTATTAWGIW